VTDRLANPELTTELRPGVRLVDAGKLPGRHVVLLMAVGNLKCIATFLLGGGRPPGTPVAGIQHAGTPRQRVIHCSLTDLAGAEVPPRIDNPAVVVIGPTVPVLRPDGLEARGGPG
jgi:siroheme synthase